MMKKVRKTAAALAAVSMLAAFSAQTAFAADKVTVSADKITANAGEEFTITVSLGSVPAAGISGVELAVAYDASALTITGASAGDIVHADTQEGLEGVAVFDADFFEAGLITVTYGVALDDSAYWVTQDGTFMTITGTVNADTPDGTYPVEIKAIERETYDGSGVYNSDIFIGNVTNGNVTDYDVTATAGSVTVGEGSTEAGMKGDADENGKVNIIDIIAINRAILGREELTPQGLKNVDLNGNGVPESEEALEILKYIVGLVKEL